MVALDLYSPITMTSWHRAWLPTLEDRCSLLLASVPLLHFLLNIQLSPFTSISLAVGFFFTHSSWLIHITELALWVKELGTFSLQDVSSLFPCLKFSSSPLSSSIFQYYKKAPTGTCLALPPDLGCWFSFPRGKQKVLRVIS